MIENFTWLQSLLFLIVGKERKMENWIVLKVWILIVAERCSEVGTAVEYLPFHFASAW